MAGNFFHLWLAQRAQARISGEREGDPQRGAAFLAGSVAPDVGFFPGGPWRFSVRLHRERSGDFLRALLAEAQDQVERAFVEGWALHVYTDLFFHPLINAQVAAFLEGRRDADPDLWHLRLEWGLDCLLLEEASSLWEVPLCFPLRPDGASLLGLVGRRFYGEDAQEARLRQGIASLRKWIRRLPRVFLWTGSTCPPGYRRKIGAAGRWAGGVLRAVIGNRFEAAGWNEGAAALRPWRPGPEVVAEADRRGAQALEAFSAGLEARFAALPNLDLQTGERAAERGHVR